MAGISPFSITDVKSFRLATPASEIADYFKKYQVLVIKEWPTGSKFGINEIRKLYADAFAMVDQTFCVEASKGQRGWCSHSSGDIFGENEHSPSKEWYASFIAQERKSEEQIAKKALKLFRSSLPVTKLTPIQSCVSSEITYTNPVWVFVGHNENTNGLSVLKGRPEHVDSVNHDGTFHYQVSGSKIWYIRPADTPEWGDSVLQINSEVTTDGEPPLKKSKTTGGLSEFADGLPRLKVVVEEGDVLVINTRVWWHQTRIPPTGKDGHSISYAIDFYCKDLQLPGKANVVTSAKKGDNESDSDKSGSEGGSEDGPQEYSNMEGLYASKPLKAGEVVFYEAELPDCALPRSEDPNCEIVWLEDGSGALCAVKDLAVGDWLTVAPSDSESDDDDEDEDGEGSGVEGEGDCEGSEGEEDSGCDDGVDGSADEECSEEEEDDDGEGSEEEEDDEDQE